MYSLYYLAHLVCQKNDINRKRRRFWHLCNPGSERFKLHESDPRTKTKQAWKAYDGDFYYFSQPKAMHPAYSKIQAEQGYNNAKLEMKAMTAHMRAVCKELKAKLIWGSSGQIVGIKHEGKTYRDHVSVYDSKHGCYRPTGRNELYELDHHYKVDVTLKTL